MSKASIQENLLKSKLTLYRYILKAQATKELTENELNIGFLLVQDPQIQNYLTEAFSNEKKYNV